MFDSGDAWWEPSVGRRSGNAVGVAHGSGAAIRIDQPPWGQLDTARRRPGGSDGGSRPQSIAWPEVAQRKSRADDVRTALVARTGSCAASFRDRIGVDAPGPHAHPDVLGGEVRHDPGGDPSVPTDRHDRDHDHDGRVMRSRSSMRPAEGTAAARPNVSGPGLRVPTGCRRPSRPSRTTPSPGTAHRAS